jgi:hypothetical protein
MTTSANRKKRPAQTAPAAQLAKAPRPALRQLIAAQFAARTVTLPRMPHSV